MMKALVLEDIEKLYYTEVEKPVPKKGEVIVRVMAAGICGSDIPRAYKEGAHNMPLITGHEFSGIVEEVGEGVSEDMTGKRVGVFPLIPCMKCGPCKNRQYEMCRNYDYVGSRRNGAFAEFVAVPAWNLTELPANVSFEAAAMLEPMAVAVHAMTRSLIGSGRAPFERTVTSEQIAVCGLGTIGTFLVMFLLEAGYKDLIVIGNKEFQRQTMLSLGLHEENYCDTNKENAKDFIMDRTGGSGADVFFECVGKNETASLAIDCAAPAGTVCFVGNPHSDMLFEKPFYWKILRNQLTVKGTWNSSFLGEKEGADDDWHYVLSRLKNKSVDPEKLITHRFPLDKLVSGFELMRDKTEDYIKVMCVPS